MAAVPKEEVDRLLDSEEPPSVEALAARGTKSPIVDLGGRDPAEYAAATQVLGEVRRFAEMTERTDVHVVKRGTKAREQRVLVAQATAIIAWLTTLLKELER